MTKRQQHRLLLVLLIPLALLLLPMLAGIQWFYSLGVLGRIMASPFIASGLWLSPRRPMLNTALGGLFWYSIGMLAVAAITSRRDRLTRALAILAILAAIAIAYFGLARPDWSMAS